MTSLRQGPSQVRCWGFPRRGGVGASAPVTAKGGQQKHGVGGGLDPCAKEACVSLLDHHPLLTTMCVHVRPTALSHPQAMGSAWQMISWTQGQASRCVAGPLA